MSELIEKIRAVVGDNGILLGEDVSNRAAGFFRRDPVKAQAIIRPANAEELSQVLKLCHDVGQPVVPHGGLTGLVEGGITNEQEIAVSTERMNKIEAVDEASRTMTVQSGVTLQGAQEHAAQHGLMLPLDLGARGTATIGGNISTNAGGNRVIRFGMMRDMVLGLEAVLADGTIVSSMNQVIKNNTGYDLKHLFIGSEGTLGMVTKAVLRLREMPKSQNTAFVALNEFGDVIRFLKRIDNELGGSLSAFEVMWNSFYRLVTTEPAKNSPPLEQEYPYYVLVEAMGGSQDTDTEHFEAALMGCLEDELLVDAVVAKSQNERDAMWAMRDDVGQTLQFAPTFTYDVSVPISSMETYVTAVQKNLNSTWPDNRTVIFGHIGDGNLHIVTGVGSGAHDTREQVEHIIYNPLRELNGAVSAEHGIGLEKKAYLDWTRNEVEIGLMRTLKQALDPKGILNPGKVF